MRYIINNICILYKLLSFENVLQILIMNINEFQRRDLIDNDIEN